MQVEGDIRKSYLLSYYTEDLSKNHLKERPESIIESLFWKTHSSKKYPKGFLRTFEIFSRVSREGREAPVSYLEILFRMATIV